MFSLKVTWMSLGFRIGSRSESGPKKIPENVDPTFKMPNPVFFPGQRVIEDSLGGLKTEVVMKIGSLDWIADMTVTITVCVYLPPDFLSLSYLQSNPMIQSSLYNFSLQSPK